MTRLGIGLPTMIPDSDPDLIAEWAVRAESGPFGSLATGELITSQAYDPFVALSVAAAVTRKINLFTNVLVLPLHNAGLVAKQADIYEKRRVILNGRGWGGLSKLRMPNPSKPQKRRLPRLKLHRPYLRW